MPRSPLIVLLTDFGLTDSYVGSMKGVILSLCPPARLVDLSHGIAPQNVKQAAFVLFSAAPYFPQGTLFVCVVDPGVGSERRILAAKTSRAIYLAPDNGLLSPLLEKEKPLELRHVTQKKFFLPRVSSTFHGRDCFAPTAARLAAQPSLFSKLGPAVRNFHKLPMPVPTVASHGLKGEVLFFDHFGNAFTNICRSLLESFRGKPEIVVKGKSLGPIKKAYYEAAKGGAVAVISSSDLLEIAVNMGSAREKLGLKEGLSVEVRYARERA